MTRDIWSWCFHFLELCHYKPELSFIKLLKIVFKRQKWLSMGFNFNLKDCIPQDLLSGLVYKYTCGSCDSLIWWRDRHCVKSVHIRNYSGPYIPAFGLNMERYGVSLHIQSECGKIRTRITPNTDIFHALR